ncbi:LAFE_0C02102g1_1 [Lachancea fermentati]|uniref:O-acyltransferase n=1 Tax=Lachancea fermentati TaxID=4955 RepID=A0A1G4M8Z6_LACFM|nr:LAFE_0C02102g1_1 [Lachancea fermentati]
MARKKLAKKDIKRIEEISELNGDRRPLPPIESGVEEYSFDSGAMINEKPSRVQLYAKRLHRKEKHRFHKNSGEMQSLLRDVDFDHRSSIMDELVNNSLRETSFQGTTWGKIKKGDGSNGGSEKDRLVIFDFSGFYVLFWMIVAFIVARVGVDYYVAHNGDLTQSEILKFMTKDVVSVAYIDLIMYLCTYFVVLVQYACKLRLISWNGLGWILTSVYEFSFVVVFLYVAEHIMKFHWISKIFIFLHSLVLLMKMHSYAFYNGYLWNVWEELKFSKDTLAKSKDLDMDEATKKTLEKSCQFCKFELESQSKAQLFPANITLKNYFIFSMFPTLVYQIEYPRTNKIRWSYVFEKLCAIFGVIFTMMIVAQFFMYPVAMRAIALRDSGVPIFWDRILQWPYLLLQIVPSFIMMYLLVWYLIWDAILNCIAELTYFGDRYFYGDWWNCVSWDEFSRQWNVPVHKFLLRHVYHSSLSFLQLNKIQATLMTFFLSSVVHELAMYVLFKKLRCYLFILQMAQLPLVALSNSKFLKKKKILGNVMFWVGICTGPSLMCTLYLTF